MDRYLAPIGSCRNAELCATGMALDMTPEYEPMQRKQNISCEE